MRISQSGKLDQYQNKESLSEPNVIEEDVSPHAQINYSEPGNQTFTNRLAAGSNNDSIIHDPDYWLHDMEYLYLRSFNELESVFKEDFKRSKEFQKMILQLNSNMIEYKFLHKAGIIKGQ